ncbi:MAG: NTP transferase domain-containing protein [Bacteroidota bacterium]
MQKHQKHAKLKRPAYGQFARNEWAIMGTPCGKIQELAFQLTQQLAAKYRIAYVDADHKSADEEDEEGRDQQRAMAYGATMEYTDKITFHRFDWEAELSSFQYRQVFNTEDLVLVNGNHFKAKRQIVVIDPQKEASLKKKLDRLSDVQLILLADSNLSPYPFLKEALPNIEAIPVLALSESQQIATWIDQQMQQAKAPLSGLVLAGGKSQRMGQDKGLIKYHGKAQRAHLFDLLDPYCESTYYSCRPDQRQEFADLPHITDSFSGLGPYGAILSAFREQPDHAWLIVAVDLPFVDQQALQQLTDQRDTSKVATAFHNPATQFPDPLITIWEPRSYPLLLQFLAQGYSCPRKVLINSEIQLIEAPQAEVLMNVNKPEDYEIVKELLAKRLARS